MAIPPLGAVHSILPQLEHRQSTLFGQLSSGNRLINSAIDAAGTALAQTLTTQVNGLAQAENNANDAVNLLQTGGAALSTTQDILQQENTLAIQAANGTLTAQD